MTDANMTAVYRIIGNSSAIRHLRELILRVAPLSLPVLIQGPTGAGKELVAQALHENSGRHGRWVALNVCAVSDSMFEDALFGHVRGAFTGATHAARGYLAEADRGTLFLDEIGGLSLAAQAKLLRAVETGEFRPVGGGTDQRSNFRLVAATNVPLEDLVERGQFRADLAYRLQGLVLDVPALRERKEDIPVLASHFVRAVEGGAGEIELTTAALRVLQQHGWPGNVRELRHVVERAVALSERSALGTAEIQAALAPTRPAEANPDIDLSYRVLVDVLERCGWDTARAADTLGVHRATIYRRAQRLGITIAKPAAPVRVVRRRERK